MLHEKDIIGLNDNVNWMASLDLVRQRMSLTNNNTQLRQPRAVYCTLLLFVLGVVTSVVWGADC